MFSNPFTPDSQKAKKSLFNQSAKALNLGRKLSERQEEAIEDILVEYGSRMSKPYKIKRTQVKF